MEKIFTPEVRTYLYGVATASIALLVALGYLADGIDTHILNLIAAVLGLGSSALATAYRPTKVPQDAPDEPVGYSGLEF